MKNEAAQARVESVVLSDNVVKRFGVQGEWRFAIQRDCDWRCVDAFGHVNNLVYLEWCQEVRSRHFAEVVGFFPGPDCLGLVIRSLEFTYHKPLMMGETALVTARLKRIGTTSYVQEYAVWNGDLCGEGSAVCVFYDAQAATKVAPSPVLRQALSEGEVLL